MKLTISVLRNIFRKYLCNMDFLEKYNAENLQDFAQTQFDFEFFLDDCDKNVNADGYLSKSHTKVLIEAGKSSCLAIAAVSSNTFVEFVFWQEVY